MIIDMDKLFKKCVFEASLENDIQTIFKYIDIANKLSELGINDSYDKLVEMAEKNKPEIRICNECKSVVLNQDKPLRLDFDYRCDYDSDWCHFHDLELSVDTERYESEYNSIDMYIDSSDKLSYSLFHMITLESLTAKRVKELTNDILKLCNVENTDQLTISVSDDEDEYTYSDLMALNDEYIFTPYYW